MWFVFCVLVGVMVYMDIIVFDLFVSVEVYGVDGGGFGYLYKIFMFMVGGLGKIL